MIALASFTVSLVLAGSGASALGGQREPSAADFAKLYARTQKLLKTSLLRPDDANWIYDNVVPAVRQLCEVAAPKDTAEMAKLFPMVTDQAKRDLLRWLAYTGSPEGSRDLFERMCSQGAKRNPSDREVENEIDAVHGLVRIGDARSGKLLSKHLSNPNANPQIRRAVYLELAQLGTDEALDAIRSVRSHSRSLQPVSLPIHPQSEAHPDGATVQASAVSKDGTKWDLIEWRGLGSGHDLWVAKRAGATWVDPAFIGESAYVQRSIPSGTPSEKGVQQELKLASLITKGEWKRFIDDPEIRKDSDADGYTDVAERWLLLDPNEADSDGDGLLDSKDKNPFVAQRDLTETEQILATVFEALVFARTDLRRNVFVKFPEKVKPFELTSWPGLVLPSHDSGKWDNVSGIGVRLGHKGDKPIRFPKDTNNAEVQVMESGGWYEHGQVFRLRKFRNVWYVTGVQTSFSFAA